jgi:hypothetical protein
VVFDISKDRSTLIFKSKGVQESLILLDGGTTVLRKDGNC